MCIRNSVFPLGPLIGDSVITSYSIHYTKLYDFGGEGFIMQKLEGDGKIFVHAGGTIIQKDLQAGEMMRIDTGCLVAMTQNVDYDIEFVGGVKSALFGGEGFFFATLRYKGRSYRPCPCRSDRSPSYNFV